MTSNELKLRERVKELKCLYELSRVAWEAQNNPETILQKTLQILPTAMQHPKLTEVCILVHDKTYSTRHFADATSAIESELSFNKRQFGSLIVGYRHHPKPIRKTLFLPEEKHLVATVARELSLVIHRASVEEEKQELQMQLQHAERLAFVGELTAGIAHELNEPLGRILGFAQLIKKAGQLNVQQSEDLERIIKASLFSREIIKKLMIFSRQMPQQLVKTNLNKIISDILYFIDVRFQRGGIQIKTKLDPALPDILADEVQLSQVIVNLITNSIYAMPQGGDISLQTKTKRNLVSLIVNDTGIGMSPDVKRKMFEPFFTTKPVGHGTGLGLSVVQGIVDTHQGKIHVESTVGKGTRFEIQIPFIQKKK